jgi:hypothetical protein
MEEWLGAQSWNPPSKPLQELNLQDEQGNRQLVLLWVELEGFLWNL